MNLSRLVPFFIAFRPLFAASFLALLLLFALPVSAGIRLDLQAGGRLGDVVEDQNGHIFIAQGMRIHTLAINAEGKLMLAGTSAPFEGMVTGLAMQGARLFAVVSGFDSSNSDAIAILRVGENGNLQTESLFEYSDDQFSSPAAMAVHGSTLFLVDTEFGLLSFDISGPGDPELIGADATTVGLFDAGIHAIDEARIVVWGVNFLGNFSLFIVDVSDPAQPVSGPGLSVPGGLDAHVDGDTLAIVGAEVALFSINDLELQLLAVLPDTAAFTAAGLGELLLLPRISSDNPVLEIWSLADPSAPVLLGETSSDLFGTGLRFSRIEVIDGGRQALHVAVDGSARLIDLTDTAAPFESDRLVLPGSVDVHATVESGGVLHLLDTHAGVTRVNPALAARDHTRLDLLAPVVDFPVAIDIASDGELLLVADWSQGVHVMRLGEAEPPEPISFVAFEFATSVAIDGKYAWAVSSTTGNSPPALISIDLTDPAAPRITSALTLSKGMRVQYREGLLYVLDQGTIGNGEGLMLFRPDSQGIPEFLTSVSPCSGPVDLDVRSGLAAVGCLFEGVFIYKLAGAATPTLLGHWNGDEGALVNTIGLDGPRLWVGDTRDVVLLDIQNPNEPKVVDRINAPGLIQGARLRPAAAGGMWLSGTNIGVLRVSDNRLLQPGQTALWFDPERSGEGWQIEILDANRAIGYWFTYDEAGNQRWLLGEGGINGLRIEFPELLVTSGPVFGPGFDPADLVMEVAGSASFEFTSCDQGRYSFDAFGQTLELPLLRLSRSMLLDCQPRASAISDRRAMQTGSWFSPERNGQGFTLQWLDDAQALITWFTYNERGEQFWIQAQGRAQGDDIVFPDAIATRGPRFGSAFDRSELELFPWGEIHLSLGCRTGRIEYHSELEQFGQGGYDLARLSIPAGLECPTADPPRNEPAL